MGKPILAVVGILFFIGLTGCDLVKMPQPPTSSSQDFIDLFKRVAQESRVTLAHTPLYIVAAEGIFAVNAQTQEFADLDIDAMKEGADIGFILLAAQGFVRSQGGGFRVTTPDGTAIGGNFFIIRTIEGAGRAIKAQLLSAPNRQLIAEVPLARGKPGTLGTPVEVRLDEAQSPNQICYSYVNSQLALTFCLKVEGYWSRAN